MNITRSNFDESFPIVHEAVNESNFVSIDTEFTGLTNGTNNLTLFDSPEERYQKLCNNIGEFIVVQYGISTFCWDASTEKYRVKAFNFYIFPHHSSYSSPDRIFSCQSSSIEFLRNQDFDFNLAFKEGIPYLQTSEEAALKNKMLEKQAQRESIQKGDENSISQFLDDEKTNEFVQNTYELVDSFLDSEEQDELLLEPCNSYLRKVLYEVLPKRFPNKISVDSYYNKKTQQRQIMVTRGFNESIKNERMNQLKLQEEANFQTAIGFSKVIKLLTESNKLIIGHNMLLDLLFTVKQFVSPLPKTLNEFKALSISVFPRLLDTKLMGSLLPFKELINNTALGEMCNALKAKPFSPPSVEVPAHYTSNDGSENSKFHEAAYDAYITGFSFLSMLHHLTGMQKSSNLDISIPALNLITPYINKIFILKTLDLPYINIGGSDLVPTRDHVFHVTFPSQWKTSDLRQLFSPFGQIVISWICDTECFVALNDRDQTTKVKAMIQTEGAEPVSYCITSYADHHLMKRSSLSLSSSTPAKNYDFSAYTSQKQEVRVPSKEKESPKSSATRKCVIEVEGNDEQDEPIAKRQKCLDTSNADDKKYDSQCDTKMFGVPKDW